MSSVTNKEIITHTKRLRRRSKLINAITTRLTLIRVVLFLVGYGWLLVLPWKGMSRTTWIDENALQPGQVNVDYSWADVKVADVTLDKLEKLWNEDASSERRAEFLADEFREMGLDTEIQSYSYSRGSSLPSITGTNAYAILRSPRISGTETIVITASWHSRESNDPLIYASRTHHNASSPGASAIFKNSEGATIDDRPQPNLRGIATVLSLAQSLQRQSVWAKDLVFLISDSYLDGAQAWLSAYHGKPQIGLTTTPLSLSAGVIWTTLVLDYPGHSFSHLGLFFEGTNGRLPNQDLVNSAAMISRGMGIPWIMYDHLDNQQEPTWLEKSWLPGVLKLFLTPEQTSDYLRRARNLVRNFRYQSLGEPSGVHGVFHKYRIDAITLYCRPAMGPHGFHSLGRMVESTLRTSNNLLERLHASFFFYVFTAPSEFAEFAKYLPPVIILGLAVSFGGLALYVQTGWYRRTTQSSNKSNEAIKESQLSDEGDITAPTNTTSWELRDRPVVEVICIMGATHLAGIATLAIVNGRWFIAALESGNFSVAIDLFPLPSFALLFLIWMYAYILYPFEKEATKKSNSTTQNPQSQPVPTTKSPEKHPSSAKPGSNNEPIITPLTPLFSIPELPSLPPTTPALLKALNLCVLGAVVSVTAVANFSLSVSVIVLAGLPLSLVPARLNMGPFKSNGAHDSLTSSATLKDTAVSFVTLVAGGVFAAAVSPVGLFSLAPILIRYLGLGEGAQAEKMVLDWVKSMLWEFSILHTWFIPFVCTLYLPLVLQGVIVCILPA